MARLAVRVRGAVHQHHQVTGERIRDKIAASKKKGLWMGGHPAAVRSAACFCLACPTGPGVAIIASESLAAFNVMSML